MRRSLSIRPAGSHSLSEKLLAGFFVMGGTLHFLLPQAYANIIPPWLPAPLFLVLLSGTCEIAGGLGVLQPRFQRAAGLGLIALSIAVFPANVQMLLNAHAEHQSLLSQLLLALRLPLQIPLVYWIWRTAVAHHEHQPILQRMQSADRQSRRTYR